MQKSGNKLSYAASIELKQQNAFNKNSNKIEGQLIVLKGAMIIPVGNDGLQFDTSA